MCGLTLVINKLKNGFTKQQQDTFATLMYLSGGFRGRDGTGVVCIDNTGNVSLAKAALSVDSFLQTDEYASIDTKAFQNGWVLMGHNRHATRGVVSDGNSHPFVVDDRIVLIHNGTFFGDHKKLKDTNVDSEAIGHVLAETQDIEEALRKINAAYALMWYNVENKELNVIRNNARPLFFMETKTAYIYASEESFLQFVKERFSLSPEEGPYEIKEHCLSQFILNDKNEMEVSCIDLDVNFHKHNPTTTVTKSPIEGAWNFLPGGDKKPLSTHDPDISSRVHNFLGSKRVAYLNGEWSKLMGEKYRYNSLIRVVVNEIIEADNNPQTRNFILIGKTLDVNEIDSIFIVEDVDLQTVINMTSQAIFEMTIRGLTWRRDDNLYPVNMKEPIDMWPGVMLLHGDGAKPIYLSEEMSVG